MGTFQITAPDGRKFRVTGDTAEGAYGALQQMLGGEGASREAPTLATPAAPEAESGAAAMRARGLSSPDPTIANTLAERAINTPPAPSGWDRLEQVGAGTQEGPAGLLGLPVDLAASGLRAIGVPVGDTPFGGSASINRGFDALKQALGGRTAPEPQDGIDRTLRRVGQDVSAGAIAAPVAGASAVRGALSGLGSGLGGSAGREATRGTAMEPVADLAGSMIGGVVAPAAMERAGRAIISPHGGEISPERQRLIDVLQGEGVDMTAGQKLGNTALQRSEMKTPAGQDMVARQREQLTAAAMRTTGGQEASAAPEALARTADALGDVFKASAQGVVIDPVALRPHIDAAVQTYRDLAPTADQAPLIGRIAERAASGQPISGTEVASWRTQVSKLTTSPNPATREAARDTLTALDDAVQGALQQAGRSDDAARLIEARRQYRDFLAIQNAATRAGAGEGVLSPGQLRSAVVQQGKSGYAQGRRGDLGELARAGSDVLAVPSTSGTAENIGGLALGSMPASAGGTLGAALGGAPGAAIGATVGGLAGPVARRAMMTKPLQAYLANQLLDGYKPQMANNLPPALINALLGTQRQD